MLREQTLTLSTDNGCVLQRETAHVANHSNLTSIAYLRKHAETYWSPYLRVLWHAPAWIAEEELARFVVTC